MNLIQLQQQIKQAIKLTASAEFDTDLTNIAAEFPPKTELGDLAFPVAFELAKSIKQSTGEKKNPREIAELIKKKVEPLEGIDKVEVAGAGYLNVFIDRGRFLADNSSTRVHTGPGDGGQKVCVEHTSVNPNKAAHIGHVRNSVLGDTFVRILTAGGRKVEVQNYIDNTGVQVADVVVGFIYLEKLDLVQIRELDRELNARGTSFDYYCWDLYTKVGQLYLTDESLKERRNEILRLIEEGANETAELADYVATRNVECILKTMDRFSIRYDLLPRESEILHLHFWDKAFEQMKRLGAVHLVNEGKHAGCWVMPFESHSGTDDHEADKILVRSNGTVTYTGKDIAYQMWKLGILGLDFYYRRFYTYPDGKEVWITTANESQNDAERPAFGGGQTVYNVIDTRQSYPQEIVKKGVASISPTQGEGASIHLSYEMVALSPSAADELGFTLTAEDRSRSFIEMSGRKGLGVKADDLIDRLEANALAEVDSRHPESDDSEKRFIAHQIAVGALRYFLLKFTRTTVIIFDFKEALSFEGETGCFCQYSAVRANSIFRKLEEKGEVVDQFRNSLEQRIGSFEVFDQRAADEIWSLLLLAARLPDVIRQATDQIEPAILAKYTFNLAKSFNLFYHNHKIISEPEPEKRSVLVLVADAARRSLTSALATMGIEVPEKM